MVPSEPQAAIICGLLTDMGIVCRYVRPASGPRIARGRIRVAREFRVMVTPADEDDARAILADADLAG